MKGFLRMMLAMVLVTLAVAVAGCGRSSGSYRSLAEARGAIEDGFIPDCLPPSTYELKDTHDHETFMGHGTFRFGQSDYGFLVKKTFPLPAHQLLTPEQQRLREGGYDFRTATGKNSSGEWIIAFTTKGFGQYWLQDVGG